MCGIFAFLGNNPEILKMCIDGLQRLEYRGYDSAGVCLHPGKDASFKLEKSAGKVANLRDQCKQMMQIHAENPETAPKVGIAHTRWATHGKPTNENAHPHVSGSGRVSVVHNGIIENYTKLKAGLSAKGYEFKSQTDSEVLAFLVDDMRNQLKDSNLVTVVSAALDLCVGTFGCVFLFTDAPDLMIGARRGSPLILGLGPNNTGDKHEFYLASDACAIVKHTRDVIYINDGETVECTLSGYKIHDTVRLAKRARRIDVSSESGTSSCLKERGADSTDYTITNPVVRLQMELEEIEKGGFDHFMLKEIYDQNNSLANCIRGRLKRLDANDLDYRGCGIVSDASPNNKDHVKVKSDSPADEHVKNIQNCLNAKKPSTHGSYTDMSALMDGEGPIAMNIAGLEHVCEDGNTVAEKFLRSNRIVMCACGTSWHSALIGEYLFEQLARIPVEVEYASEFRYRKPLITENDIIVGISQSGETADTLEALRLGSAHGATTFGVVNVVGSTIARETIAGMYIHAGPEVGVASTKAFTGQCMALFLIALYLARKNNQVVGEEFERLALDVIRIPELCKRVIEEQNDLCYKLGKEIRLANNFLFLGRGLNFPVALEGALKLKEISYIHAEGYPAAEMKHGPIALIDQFMPVVIIAPRNDPTYLKVQANIEEVHARNGTLIIITDEGNTDFDKISDYIIKLPTIDQYLQPLLSVIPLQLMSYYVAKFRGCAIDQPRNLAKSVTVE